MESRERARRNLLYFPFSWHRKLSNLTSDGYEKWNTRRKNRINHTAALGAKGSEKISFGNSPLYSAERIRAKEKRKPGNRGGYLAVLGGLFQTWKCTRPILTSCTSFLYFFTINIVRYVMDDDMVLTQCNKNSIESIKQYSKYKT